MKQTSFIVLASLVITVSLFGLGILSDDIRKLKEEPVQDIPLTEINDGIYQGFWRYGIVTCTVEVIVVNHEIINIHVLDGGSSSYAERGEQVINRIISEQSLQVDTISGATTSSKAYIKAVEDALAKGRTKIKDN